MRASKQDTSLNERDALQDMLNVEKQLMGFYAQALTEGNSKAFRKHIFDCYADGAETQFHVYEQMLARGYYTVQTAEKSAVEEKAHFFGKVEKELEPVQA